MKKVSFDFDGCLGHRADVQEFCKDLIKRDDVEIWIVTSRPEFPEQHFSDWSNWLEELKLSNNDDLFPLAAELGIPRERIVFTWPEFKATWFIEHGRDFVFHLDDDSTELRELRGYVPSIMAVYCYGSGIWRSKCLRALDNFNKEII
jgi:hypothetical protein